MNSFFIKRTNCQS